MKEFKSQELHEIHHRSKSKRNRWKLRELKMSWTFNGSILQLLFHLSFPFTFNISTFTQNPLHSTKPRLSLSLPQFKFSHYPAFQSEQESVVYSKKKENYLNSPLFMPCFNLTFTRRKASLLSSIKIMSLHCVVGRSVHSLEWAKYPTEKGRKKSTVNTVRARDLFVSRRMECAHLGKLKMQHRELSTQSWGRLSRQIILKSII